MEFLNLSLICLIFFQEIYDAYFWFFKRCEEYFLCKYLPPDGIDSVGEHISLEVSIYLQQFPEPDRKLRKSIFNYLLNRETCISGCDSMNEIDLMEIGSYTELPGGNIVLPGGYSSILAPLTKQLQTDSLLKGHVVSQINWKPCVQTVPGANPGSTTNENLNDSNTGACSYSSQDDSLAGVLSPGRKSKNSKVEIVCENGKKFICESVICTVPLGVLKEKGKTMFNPPLPEYKVESIERLCFGTVDKIYLEYERPFLNPDLTEIVLLWDTIDPKETLIDRWFKKIYSFTKVSETLLLGWVSGEEAKFMETLPFDTVSEKCTQILRQFLNDPFVPKPKRCIW